MKIHKRIPTIIDRIRADIEKLGGDSQVEYVELEPAEVIEFLKYCPYIEGDDDLLTAISSQGRTISNIKCRWVNLRVEQYLIDNDRELYLRLWPVPETKAAKKEAEQKRPKLRKP